MEITLQQALDRLNQAQYSKVWDMTGPCIVVRETWTDATGTVTREHNFTEDNPPPKPVEADEGDQS